MTNGLLDQEVQELIQSAEGGVKERRGYWYTLGIPINHYYSLDEQLNAIRKLGTSENLRAYDYLKKLPISRFISFAPVGWDGHTFDDTDYGGMTVYENAKGKLRGGLESGEANVRNVIQEALLPFLRRLEEENPVETAKVYSHIGMRKRSDELFLRLINDLESKCLFEEALKVAEEACGLSAQLYFDSGFGTADTKGVNFYDRRKAIRLKLCDIAETEGRLLDAERYLHEGGGEVGYGERRKELLERAVNAYESQGMYLEAANIAGRLSVMGSRKYNHDLVKEMELRAIDECEKQGLFDKIANIYSGFSDVDVKVVDVLEKHGFHKEAAVAAARSLIYVKDDGFRDRTINLHLKVIEELERKGRLEEAAQFAQKTRHLITP